MRIDDTTLFHAVSGKGEPLVLVHDGLLSSAVWRYQEDAFAKRYSVIAYDRRGYGCSSATLVRHSAHEDLRALLDFLGVEQASFIGISAGGSVVLDFALCHPRRVKNIITVGGWVGGVPYGESLNNRNQKNMEPLLARGDFRQTVENWLHDANEVPGLAEDDPKCSFIADLMTREFLNLPRVFHCMAYTDEMNPPAASRLEEITAPALVMTGELDREEVIQTAEMMRARMANAERREISGAGHLINLTKPEEFNEIALDFLKRR